MNSEIYRRTIVPASEAADGETPTAIIVTKEANIFIVWRESLQLGTEVLWCQYGASREDAIEHACGLVDQDNGERM